MVKKLVWAHSRNASFPGSSPNSKDALEIKQTENTICFKLQLVLGLFASVWKLDISQFTIFPNLSGLS